MKRKKHKITFIIVPILVIVVVITSVMTVFSDNSAMEDFECNHESVITSPRDAKSTLAKYAEENNLSLSEWPIELKQLMLKNPETTDFVLNYPTLKDKDFDIDLSEHTYTDSVPLFLQWDKRWGYESYDEDMIAIAGCGPTCLSMVCVHLLHDESLDPKTIADFSVENGYRVDGNGSSWSLISEGGPQLGLNVWELPLDEQSIISNLEQGNPIICVMGPGDFTQSGHFIVMTDYIDGMIKINDPNSIIRSEKLWDFYQIKDQINNLWACSSWY